MQRFVQSGLLPRSPRHLHYRYPWRNATHRYGITTKSNNPFHILGLPTSSPFQKVQKAFVKLALEHHPDTAEGKNCSEQFVRIRQAFERIREGERPYKNENAEINSWIEDFLQWFNEQTGLLLTSDQRQEMVNLYQNRIPGGRYDGPHWDLVRRLVVYQDAFLRQRQQRGGRPPKAASNSSNGKTKNTGNSNLRRKRRR